MRVNRMIKFKYLTAAVAAREGKKEAKKNRPRSNPWAGVKYRKAAKRAREIDVYKLQAIYNDFLLPYRRKTVMQGPVKGSMVKRSRIGKPKSKDINHQPDYLDIHTKGIVTTVKVPKRTMTPIYNPRVKHKGNIIA